MKRDNKFIYISALLAVCCIALSIFLYVNWGKRYQEGFSVGYEQGYEAGYNSGIADTKEKYTKSKQTGVAVYITPSGKKYHEKGCSYLSDKAFSILLKDAKEKGYTPCSRCNPPR